ncbi:MAG TPA: hypothetical protein VJJ23_01135 [Candidatus Nanoarchaeia archaeon]|nr:hypothetical protein [Candidatus Nanoarchaeia archaeon]
MKKIKQIYQEELPTLKYHLASVVISTGLSALAAKLLEKHGCDPATVSTLTSAIALTSYWAPFIGLLTLKDKKELKANGHYDRKKITSKALEYASFMGIGEVAYSAVRGVAQYCLQKKGFDAVSASAGTDLACATLYGILLPPIRYLLRNRSKVINKLEDLVQ